MTIDPATLTCVYTCCFAHPNALLGLFQKVADGYCHGGWIAIRDKKPGFVVSDDFALRA